MTYRPLVTALFILLTATVATADEPGPIFRFTEYKHPLPQPSSNVVLSPDGKLMAAATAGVVAVWETKSGRPVARVQLPRRQTFTTLAFTADGKTLVTDTSGDTAVRFWNLKTGNSVRELEHPDGRVMPGQGSFSLVAAFDKGANRLVTYGGAPGTLRVHDATTGKVAAELEGTNDPRRVVFSPDGGLVAVSSGSGALTLLDANTGRKLRELIPADPQSRRMPSIAAFSPDGNYVVEGEPANPGQVTLQYLTVWRVADGKRCARVFTGLGFTSTAFAKDGRTLAASGGPHGLYLYDLATDTLHLSVKLEPSGVSSVAATPDGSTLAVVAARDNGRTVYVMPFPKYEDDSFGPTGPTEKQLAESWEAILGDNEFRKAHEIARLRPHADRVVALAREKVQPVPDLFRQRAADLVENLDSPDIRDKVTENLHLVAHEFEPLLESARKKAPEGDVRNRLTAVLKKMKETPPPEKLTAAVRAVEVLERLDTPAATKALEELAAGAAGAKVTTEAAAALKRIADKPRGQN